MKTSTGQSIIIVFIGLLLFSCNNSESKTDEIPTLSVMQKSKSPNQPYLDFF